jgi:hypothetical protein
MVLSQSPEYSQHHSLQLATSVVSKNNKITSPSPCRVRRAASKPASSSSGRDLSYFHHIWLSIRGKFSELEILGYQRHPNFDPDSQSQHATHPVSSAPPTPKS